MLFILFMHVHLLGKLSLNNLKVVCDALCQARSMWEDTGIELGISKNDIDAIRKERSGECLTELLSDYLKKGTASWCNILLASRAQSVNCNNLADEIQVKVLVTDRSVTDTASTSSSHEDNHSSDTTQIIYPATTTATANIMDNFSNEHTFECACGKCTHKS